MRLPEVEHRHAWYVRAFFALIHRVSGEPVPDVLRTLLFRPTYFGLDFSDILNPLMRGPSPWSVAERELFASFTSSLNQCVFWTGAHGAVASEALGTDAVTRAVLADWRTAPVDPKVRAALALIEKLAREPDAFGADDVSAARAAGLDDDAIEDAAQVCAMFTVLVRLADTMKFALPERGFARSAKMLLKVGYAYPPPLGWIARLAHDG